jgi:hypothetical protein
LFSNHLTDLSYRRVETFGVEPHTLHMWISVFRNVVEHSYRMTLIDVLQLVHCSSFGIHFIKSFLNKVKSGFKDWLSEVNFSTLSGNNCLTDSKIASSLYCSDIHLCNLRVCAYDENWFKLLPNLPLDEALETHGYNMLCMLGSSKYIFSAPKNNNLKTKIIQLKFSR